MTAESVDFQRIRYDSEAQDYLRHHGDHVNQLYRDQFIRRRIFTFDLTDKRVLDAMCASGTETGFLVSKGADVIGLDVSENNAALYRQLWNRQCVVHSIHRSEFPPEAFDVVYICGGLHHILPHLRETLVEIHRILRPHGRFCFMEPNADTWLNYFRRLWYRMDRRFHTSEAAISYPSMMSDLLKLGFQEEKLDYGGNIAYLLISQSLVLRIPHVVKRLSFRPLFLLESFIDRLPFAPRLFLTGVWRKL